MVLFFEKIFRVFKIISEYLLGQFSQGDVLLTVISQIITSLIETVEYLVPPEIFSFVVLGILISLFIRFFLRL